MPNVVITGVSRGLGRSLVHRFVEAGWTVAGCARSESAIAKLRVDFSQPHEFQTVDVTRDEELKSWANGILSRIGPPDLLVNNAAIINANAPLWEVSSEEFSHVLDVNLKGVHSVIRHFLPAMIERKKGVIVNFSSGWGRSTSADVAPYCATKWGIEGLSQALAQELPAGMASVALNPGIIDTDMLRSCFGGSSAHYPDAQVWSRRAAPFLMKLSARDNGGSLDVPGT